MVPCKTDFIRYFICMCTGDIQKFRTISILKAVALTELKKKKPQKTLLIETVYQVKVLFGDVGFVWWCWFCVD